MIQFYGCQNPAFLSTDDNIQKDETNYGRPLC